ncbi:MAG: hypothetical protein JSW14_02555 [Candidatus Bathyarchaeum sp.]|nr:MAG: hypothetical protein JSW14_02555 [Candidatus Bathyarchaeum sp.]
MNKIFRKFSLYSRWTELSNDVSLPPKTLREILNSVRVETLGAIGSKCGTLDYINVVNAMGLRKNYDSFVYLLTEHLGGPNFAKWFHCFHHVSGNKDIFHLQHNLGHNWSVYLKAYIISCLRSVIDTDVKTRVYDYAVTFMVTRPSDARIKSITQTQTTSWKNLDR